MTVTTAELSPFVVGIVYCGVILACEEVFEVGRAREWTLALTEWAEQQRDLVAFTGRCLVHRAQILQLSGSWSDALEEARRAGRRFDETKNPAAGHCAVPPGASSSGCAGSSPPPRRRTVRRAAHGWEPQPGLAQLRLAQGKADAALAADPPGERRDRRAAQAGGAASGARRDRARGRRDRGSADGVSRARGARRAVSRARCSTAMVAYARGAVALAEGDAHAALVSLREAQQVWLELDAPYEVARTRALVARACSRARRRRGRRAGARGRVRDLPPSSGRRPISRASRRRARSARRTACRDGSSRCCASSRRARATARSPRRS